MNEFCRVEQLIVELQKEVNLYQDMFGDEETVKTLNKSSFNAALAIFQRSMWFEIICRTSALFDPEANGKDKNLTLDYLTSLCKEEKLTKELYLRVEAVKYDFQKTDIKKIRNKLLAHNDLNARMERTSYSLKINYDTLSGLLNELFSVVRSLGLASEMVDPKQLNYRDGKSLKLPKCKDGVALVKVFKNNT